MKIGKVVDKKQNREKKAQKRFLHCKRKKANYILELEFEMIANEAYVVFVRITVYMSAPVRRLEGCRLSFYRKSCGKRQKRV